jgi:hypothetical protein
MLDEDRAFDTGGMKPHCVRCPSCRKAVSKTYLVGASLLANAVYQQKQRYMTHRFREQATPTQFVTHPSSHLSGPDYTGIRLKTNPCLSTGHAAKAGSP